LIIPQLFNGLTEIYFPFFFSFFFFFKFGIIVPPFLRYGKYCGLLYSGCPGEKPCDGLDACCMNHDACVVKNSKFFLDNKSLIMFFLKCNLLLIKETTNTTLVIESLVLLLLRIHSDQQKKSIIDSSCMLHSQSGLSCFFYFIF
jgi:hypothetical protein